MTTPLTEATFKAGISDLINELSAQKSAEEGTAGPRRGGAGLGPGGYEVDLATVEKELAALKRLEERRGSLSLVQKESLKQKEAELEAINDVIYALESEDALLQTLQDDLRKLREVQAKNRKEMQAGEAIAKNYEDKLFGISGAFDELYTNYIPKTGLSLKGLGTSLNENIISWDGLKSGAVAMIGVFFNMAMAADKAFSSFRANTGAGREYKEVMEGVRNTSRDAGVGFEEASKAMESLYGEMSGFTELSKAEQGTLTNTVALMSELGVSTSTSAKLMDTATKSLGMTAAETDGLARSLKDTAISLGKPINDVVADFASAAPKLAFYGKKMVDVFMDLEKQSKATGLSVDQILGLTGEQFDTFEGAGKAVGKLNAILGGPYLNSIDMVNASEAERMEMLKGAVDASGVIFSELNKYEQKMFASAMGTDVDTLRRAMGNLSAAEELEIKKQEELATLAADSKSVMEELQNAIKGLIVDNKDLFDDIILGIKAFSEWLRTVDKSTVTGLAWGVMIAGSVVKLFQLISLLKGIGVLTAFSKGLGLIKTAFLGLRAGVMALSLAWNMSPLAVVTLVVAGIALIVLHIKNMKDAGYSLTDMFVDLGMKIVTFGSLALGPFGLLIPAAISFFNHLRKGKGFVEALTESVKDLANNLTFGLAGKIFGFGTNIERKKVEDAVITSKGDVIDVHKEDDIIAAKPNGPISRLMQGGAKGADDASSALRASPMGLMGGVIMKALSGNLLRDMVTDPIVKALSGREGDVNVVVKIGEKELNKQIVQALSSTEAAQTVGPFAMRR